MKKLKLKFAVNDQNPQNIIIYDMESDTEMLLNEQASLILLNGEKPIDEIVDLFHKEYYIRSDSMLISDIQNMQAFFEETLYE
ncbi:hypothetical protein [Murdochiella massiliensis]|uniref:hypothetical protein n=1 Tax=Murdochiella massiliensis TaxID=1673723 RepID=UPI000830BC7B|nr:hypothetical protein [Murdochiella massiliensis]